MKIISNSISTFRTYFSSTSLTEKKIIVVIATLALGILTGLSYLFIKYSMFKQKDQLYSLQDKEIKPVVKKNVSPDPEIISHQNSNSIELEEIEEEPFPEKDEPVPEKKLSSSLVDRYRQRRIKLKPKLFTLPKEIPPLPLFDPPQSLFQPMQPLFLPMQPLPHFPLFHHTPHNSHFLKPLTIPKVFTNPDPILDFFDTSPEITDTTDSDTESPDPFENTLDAPNSDIDDPTDIPLESSQDEFIENLELLKNYHYKSLINKNLYVTIDNINFDMIFFKTYDQLNILHCRGSLKVNQNDNIKITFDSKGKITSIVVNNSMIIQESKDIPKVWLERLEIFVEKVLELSSTYNNAGFSSSNPRIFFHVLPKSLQRIPEFHLKQLSSLFFAHKNSLNGLTTNVNFLNTDMKSGMGIDSGGLTRHFFSLLFSNLTKCKGVNFHQAQDSLLLMPIANANQALQPPTVTALISQEQDVFYQIGIILMSCYRITSKPFNIGKIFDDALFYAIFCLTEDEIDTSFEQLSNTTKLKMCDVMIRARIDAGEKMDFLLKRIQTVLDGNNFPANELQDVVYNEFYAGGLPDQFINEDQPDMDKVNANIQEFLDYMTDAIFSHESESLGMLGSTLAPIHSMANGMKTMVKLLEQPDFTYPSNFTYPSDFTYPWFNSKSKNYVGEFILKVQGSLDRKEICNRIIVSNHLPSEIKKKVSWMKEWITDNKKGATESELKNFLKYFTGSTTLTVGKQINVSPQFNSFSPIPHAHSCSFGMNISPHPCGNSETDNDLTRENFYKILRKLNPGSNPFNIG